MRQAENLITDWLEKHADPEIDKFVEKNIAITEKVRIALEEKNWTFRDLANAMGKSPSEVSKWLTGLHNLTLKSIVKMEMALGIDILDGIMKIVKKRNTYLLKFSIIVSQKKPYFTCNQS